MSPAEDVILTWDVLLTKDVRIHLVSALEVLGLDQKHPKIPCLPLPPPTTTQCVGDDDNRKQQQQPEEKNESRGLRFERHLRKVQHAKKASAALHPEDLSVVYHDEHIVVVNKPAGVLTVPGVHARDSLLSLVYAQFGIKVTDNGEDDGGDAAAAAVHMIVHRLDMDTSGLVIFGRSRSVTKQLHSQFRDHQVMKEYECLVQGHLPLLRNESLDVDTNSKAIFHMDLPLQRDHAHPPFMRVSTPASETEAAAVLVDLKERGWTKLTLQRPKPSRTLFRILERGWRSFFENDKTTTLPFTRLRLEPLTGRTHQLRVHCAALGYPIVGDPTYGLYGEAAASGGIALLPSLCRMSDGSVGPVECCSLDLQQDWTRLYAPNEKQMCLHAAMLQLDHPVTGEVMRWEVPPDF
jgi:tRNA pseudouridine32 synthase / 23S rRNA pseudouridine746 synthase